MRRKRKPLTSGQLKKRIEYLETQNQFKTTRQRRYNRLFRKTPFFKLSWGIRIAYFVFLMVIYFFHNKHSHWREEIVFYKDTQTHIASSRTGTRSTTLLYLETNITRHKINITGLRIPILQAGDTVQIEVNTFNRPICFTKQNWPVKIPITPPFFSFFMVGFVAFVSLFFNNGLDKYTYWLLPVVALCILFVVAGYFMYWL
ncbi:MAG: hypothetical protein QM534_06370 [Sediminibacterium sp.]|nr:hypothetical protein [Sediminibacterium sp.]